MGKKLDKYKFRIKSLIVSWSIWWVSVGPDCRFVYPDLIKSYFIENVPCSLHICTFFFLDIQGQQRTGCGKLWSQQVQLPSRLFQKPASKQPFRKNKRQHSVIMPGLWKQTGYEILRNPAEVFPENSWVVLLFVFLFSFYYFIYLFIYFNFI